MEIHKREEHSPNIIGFTLIDDLMLNHGMETEDTRTLRDAIKRFFSTHEAHIAQELGTGNFSVMVGGSIQAGTADPYSDIDLSIIIDRGDTGKIWEKGDIGRTHEGIRGILLFGPDSFTRFTQREVDVRLISVHEILTEIENRAVLDAQESDTDLVFIRSEIVCVFSPQLYQTLPIEHLRKSIVTRLASIIGGASFWDHYIVPDLTLTLCHIGDKKGDDWPERVERNSAVSQAKNNLTNIVAQELSKKLKIPSWEELKRLYGLS